MYRILAFKGLVIHLVILTAVESKRVHKRHNPHLLVNNDLTWTSDTNTFSIITPYPRTKTQPLPNLEPSLPTTPTSTKTTAHLPIKKESYVERIMKIRAQKAQKAALNYKLKKHVEDIYWLTRLKRGSRNVPEGTLYRKDTRKTTPPPERRYNSAIYKPTTLLPATKVDPKKSSGPSGLRKLDPTNLISSDHKKIQLNFISNDLEDFLEQPLNEINSAQASKKVYSYITTTFTTSPTTKSTPTTTFVPSTTTTTTSVINTSTEAYPSTQPLPTTTSIRNVILPTPAYEPVTIPRSSDEEDEFTLRRSTPTFKVDNFNPFDRRFPIYYKPSYYNDPQWYKARLPQSHKGREEQEYGHEGFFLFGKKPIRFPDF
ncbi:uncharacterized protein [Lepeophtheirus salmonis]|uniref:uncharacterized protein isoform X2 n=1 Tax=Lepeophtheirus salmonis TaxID=72036 RepID=UPI001AEB78A5|nr:mucin-5AC-like [Lepeophtheirus salmonis]